MKWKRLSFVLLASSIVFGGVLNVNQVKAVSSNLITNGDYSGGETGWYYYMDNTAMAYRSVVNGEYKLQIDKAGTYAYSMQINQWHVPIVNGRTYQVTFDARTPETSRTILSNVGMRENPWTNYSGGNHTFTLSNTIQTFSYTFTMTEVTDLEAQLSFQVGQSTSDVILDNVAVYDLTGGTLPAPSPMPTPSVTYNNLVWSDEFNGTSIDSSAWTFETGTGMNGWGNGELQFYTSRPENARIETGSLVIEARKENYRGASYTSARLKTQGKKQFKYGKIEARIKLPKGQGMWPAFWMLGSSIGSGTRWPDCGEVDIMEMIGGGYLRDDTMYGTIHYSQADGSHMNKGNSNTLSSGIFADDYHIVSIVWDPNYIYYFLDGVQYHAATISEPEKSEFQQPFFLLLNLAVGGIWPGNPDKYTTVPQKYYVDYVRVYQ
jgi:beta-glucanase (GH16 family)